MLWKRARSGTKSPITAAIASYARTGARALEQVGVVGLEMEMQMQMQMAMLLLSRFWEGARMRRRVRQRRKGREERKRRIKTDDRQLKAQDKSLKISAKENRGVGSREGRI